MRTIGSMALLLLLFCGSVTAQERNYSLKALTADLDYLQQQLYNVHADPYSELDKQKWDGLFERMRTQLKDSMTAAAFYTIVKPAISFLSDEHAELTAPAYFTNRSLFLPFSLKATPAGFTTDTVWGNSVLKKGDRIAAVNNVPVAELLQQLNTYTTGFPDERKEKTLVQFGYLYGLSHPFENTWNITLADGKKLSIQPIASREWMDYLKNVYGTGQNKQLLSYKTSGKTGYLTVPDFSVKRDGGLDQWRHKIDSFFALAANDGVTRMVIDVSRNSGGNSAVGTILIDHFYSKPYKSYQMNWRRSDEYLSVARSYGSTDDEYANLAPGKVLHRDSHQERPSESTPKFKGKVYVVVGNGTFSSAIMFASIIKDNRMAILIGETPSMGHPTHFGELYSTKLPNTGLPLRFGVKEWIRPAGKKIANRLEPDVLIAAPTAEKVLALLENK